MPSTHLSLHYHVVFSTKNRVASINTAWRERLHAYLGGVVRNDEGVPDAIGGVADHLHLLIGLRATACLAEVVRDVCCRISLVMGKIQPHQRTQPAMGLNSDGEMDCHRKDVDFPLTKCDETQYNSRAKRPNSRAKRSNFRAKRQPPLFLHTACFALKMDHR